MVQTTINVDDQKTESAADWTLHIEVLIHCCHWFAFYFHLHPWFRLDWPCHGTPDCGSSIHPVWLYTLLILSVPILGNYFTTQANQAFELEKSEISPVGCRWNSRKSFERPSHSAFGNSHLELLKCHGCALGWCSYEVIFSKLNWKKEGDFRGCYAAAAVDKWRLTKVVDAF